MFHRNAGCLGDDVCETSNGIGNQFIGGIMSIVLGIITFIRMSRNMPNKMTEVGDNSVYYNGDMMKVPVISIDDHMVMMKRIADLEEKVNTLSIRPSMPLEKEELLNSALNRVATLEQELAMTKKVCFLFILPLDLNVS